MTALSLVGRIAIIVFGLELCLMGVLHWIDAHLPPLAAMVLDASVLTGLSSFAIWRWVVHPYVRARNESAAALRQQGEVLQLEMARREQAQAQLKPLSVAMAHIPTSVVITDPDGCITWVNQQFVRLTGYEPEDVIGHNARIQKSGKTPPDTYVAMWERLLKGKAWRGEFVNKRKNGGLYWESAFIAPIADDAGEIQSYVAVKLDISEEKQREQLLRDQALTDPLTGASNRRGFDAIAAEVMERAGAAAEPLSVLMIDVDHFKRINDHHGHPVGDRVLAATVRQLKDALRDQDVVARMGGEEFAVMLPRTRMADALLVADRLRVQLSGLRVSSEVGDVRFTVSVGVATRGLGDDKIDQILERADQALYLAKQGGRDRVVADSSVEAGDIRT